MRKKLSSRDSATQIGSTPRECGGCTACCTAMAVPALNKAAGQPCEHQRPSGCGNYADRPEACRAWHCMWVRDAKRLFEENERPDRLGVFFTASPPDPITGSQVVHAHETRPDAARRPPAAERIRFFRRFLPVRIFPYRPPSATLTLRGQPLS